MATTPLDDKLVPVAVATLKKYGVDTTVNKYLSRTEDKVRGTVEFGSPTPYTVKATPPVPFTRGFLGDGRAIHREAVEFHFAYGEGTADEIRFTPERGDRWTIVTGQEVRALEVRVWSSGYRRVLVSVIAEA